MVSTASPTVSMSALAIVVVYGAVVDAVIPTLQNELVAKSGIAVLDGFRACQVLYGVVIGGLIVTAAAIHSV
jgi:hypothetical protein